MNGVNSNGQLATVTPITSITARNAGLISSRAQPYKLQTQPNAPIYPAFHPLSSSYTQAFDLKDAADAFADEQQLTASIKARSFPQDVFSTWERVEAVTGVARMAGQTAAINYGLTELNNEPIIVARVDLWKRVKAKNDLPLKIQTRIDRAIDTTPYSPAAGSGVRPWGIRTTEEFRGQLSSAARRIGVLHYVLATVCMCRAMWDQPGVSDEAAAMIHDIYTDFLDAVEWATDTLNGGFTAACARHARDTE